MKATLIATALTVLAASSAQADQKRIIGLRETVGSVAISGWEQGLVQANPNLGHWHWTPVYANIQRIRTWGDPNPTQPGANKSTTAREPNIPPPHYVKPIQLPLPEPQWHKELAKLDSLPRKPHPVEDRSQSSSQSNLFGLLVSKKTTTVAAYDGDYSRASLPGQAEHTAVHGRLTSPRL